MSMDVAGSESFADAFARIAAARRELRLPTMFGLEAFVDSGGLLSYSPDFADLCRRSALYVDKILKGARPAELPIQPPTHFRLAVNLGTAKAIGLRIPESILLRADRVIE